MRTRLAAAVMILTAAAGCSSQGNATREASCVGPTLTVTPIEVSAGQQIHVHGEWFSADCVDVISAGAKLPVPRPLKGLIVQVSQQGQDWVVASGVAASGPHNSFDVVVRLPTALAKGTAAVGVHGHGAPVHVIVYERPPGLSSP